MSDHETDPRLRLSRRGFLALSGAGAAGVAASGCSEHGIADFLELAGSERRVPGGKEKWTTSICGECTGGCSVRVRTVGGRAVGLTGNPLYPLNRGGMCPKGLAALQSLYNPDRVEGPLAREGRRGEGRWRHISWDEALRTVAGRLRALREQREPHRVVFLSGETRGLMSDWISRFCRGFGTPNDVRETVRGQSLQATTRYCMQGTSEPFAWDVENSRYILSCGAPLLDDYAAPVHMLRAYGQLRQGGRGEKAQLVQVEPRFSTTAAKADEWIPINPGTEAALVLGIAHVLVRERLYDEDFVAAHTFGFDDWRDEDGTKHLGFRELLLRDYGVDGVARTTGVPVTTILRVAKEMAERRPAVALAEPSSSNALYTSLAVHALNALLGSIDVPGGLVFPRGLPPAALPDLELDETARYGVAHARLDHASTTEYPLVPDVADALYAAIAEATPYEAGALLLYRTNPLFSSPSPQRVRRALDRVPLIVSFASSLDETAAHADFILPDHTPLERWQDDPAPAAVPYALFGLRQPVIEPLHDTQHTADALLALAREIGGATERALPFASFAAAVRDRARTMFEARRGAIVEDFIDSPWVALLQERGWWSPEHPTFEKFWDDLQSKGGWWDPMYYHGEWDRIFQTATGKLEFYSLALRRHIASGASGDADAALGDAHAPLSVDLQCLPHFEPPRFAGDADEFPLHLNVVRLMPLTDAHHAAVPFLQEIVGPHVGVRWNSWIEINPHTAATLGIADGDSVRVESPSGALETTARLYVGAMPNVVSMPANLGRSAGGRWAENVGANPMQLLDATIDRLSGMPAPAATRVRVSKA